jgi:hypothetical protein
MSGAVEKPLDDDAIANMSDEELMAMEAPTEGVMPSAETGADEDTSEGAEADQGEEGAGSSSSGSVEDEADDAAKDGDEGAESDEDGDEEKDKTPPVTDKAVKPKPGAESGKGDKPAAADAAPGEGDKAKAKEPTTPVDYKAAYEQIFAPFKANGRQIQMKSPEEVISLMQMGANYTQKLQALQPTLKMVRMLENNGLLNEEKITFMIDVNRKDPAAIAKLLKEGNVDPMDIDVTKDPEYKPGNHRVSDADMRFSDAISDVSSSPQGVELIREIERTWDAESKKAIWNDPNIMQVLRDQRETGVYAKVAAELDRQKMLGQFSGVPFLHAYYAVAVDMQKQGLLTSTTPANPGAAPQVAPAQPNGQRQVLDQRPMVPKKASSATDDRVRAAQATKPAASPAKADFNPLAMSDEEFEKSAALNMRL